MGLTLRVELPNGKMWGAECGFWRDAASVVVPINQLDGMTDEEIGQAVRHSVRYARKAEALLMTEWLQGVTLKDAEYQVENFERLRAVLAPFADEESEIAEAVQFLDQCIERRDNPPPPKRPRQVRPGYIYLMHSQGLYKIGKSINPDKRLSQLRTSSPVSLSLTHSIQVADMSAVEKALHTRFADRRKGGEWFGLLSDDVQWLLSHQSMTEAEARL